jgi:glycosyltransferase involved in cell wall biosynthesis
VRDPIVGVAATPGELATSGTRVVWDGPGLYSSLLRWGGNRIVPALSRPLASRARSVCLYALSRVGDRLPAWRGGPARRRIRDIAQVQRFEFSPDVHVLYGHMAFPTSRPTRPTVWSTNGVFDARPGTWFPRQSAITQRSMILRSAVSQCWTEMGRQGIVEHVEGVPEEKLFVVPPLMYVDTPSTPWPRTDDDVIAIFVGAFGEMKGLDVVLEVARGAQPGVRIEIITASRPPDELPTNVRWLGPRPRDEVLRRMASSDLHLFPSTTESFGAVVVEALAFGLPQIVDHASVTAEVAGEAGVTVDGRDAQSVQSALERLAGDALSRRALGRAARERYLRVYSPDAVGPQLEELFRLAAA